MKKILSLLLIVLTCLFTVNVWAVLFVTRSYYSEFSKYDINFSLQAREFREEIHGSTSHYTLINGSTNADAVTINGEIVNLWHNEDVNLFTIKYPRFPDGSEIQLYKDGNTLEIKLQSFNQWFILEGGDEVVIGDVNGDGKIDTLDCALVKRYILGIIDQFPYDKGLYAADVDGNGNINSTDYIFLKKYILEIIDKLPR